MTRKDILREVATSLYLLIMFSKPTPNMEWDELDEKILDDTRVRAQQALQHAERIIGPLNSRTARELISTKDDKFTLDCGRDIVKGDIIRFQEDVFDNRRSPPLPLGQRTVIAEVNGLEPEGRDFALSLRIIRTTGVWLLAAGSHHKRILRYAAKYGITRTPWPDESKRLSSLNTNEGVHNASRGRGLLGRYDTLKS